MERDPARLTYLFGDDVLQELEAYDLDRESDVMELVERHLPLPPGAAMAGARSAVRTIVVTQLLNDDPPEAWRAVERMRDAGLGREAVISELSMVVSEQVISALAEDRPADPADLVAALDALPLPDAEQIAQALVAVARAEPGIAVETHISRTAETLGFASDSRVLTALVNRVVEEMLEAEIHWLVDDTTVVFHDTIAGRTFTHRVNELERELGSLTVSVDLAAFGRFDTVRLLDGAELDQLSVESGHLSWAGPDGWLDAFRPGDLIAVTAAFEAPSGSTPIEATVTLSPVGGDPAMPPTLVTAVRAAYDAEHHEHGLPVSAEDLTIWLCHHHPELFTAEMPPLSECCEAAGLQWNGSMVAHDATVWRRDMLHRRLLEIEDLVSQPNVRRTLGRAVEVLAEPDSSPDDVRASLAECAEPDIVDVLADVLLPELISPDDELLRDAPMSPAHAFELVQRATTVARRHREVATAEYLACVLRERCGQPLLAAEHLARAAEAQPRLGPVVERMGWYCFDRGDARGAMRWWRELDEVHPGASTIAPLLVPATGRAKVGRNDPCWCGSGRKFKQCHQLASELPALPDRVAWLCRKATLWLEHVSGEPRRLVTDLAIAWVAGDPDAEPSDVMDDDEDEMRADFAAAFSDPILFDAALHEGGLLARFLSERGELLPDDERLLASAWLTVSRSVHEVVGVERGVGMTLRDLATGDVVDVRERTASRAAHVGERFCARVVPDGASHQIVGGMFPVHSGQEESVLELCSRANPLEVCAWAGAIARPPRVVHQLEQI